MLGQEVTELRLALKRVLENQDRTVVALERIAAALERLAATPASASSPTPPCGAAVDPEQDGGGAP